MAIVRTKWWLPLVALGVGLVFLVAFWIGGEVRAGITAFGVMAVLGLAVLAGGRSELVRGLRGDGRDEYWEQVDFRASLFAGMTVLAAVVAMCAWEWAHGREGTPYTQLGALGGISYVASLIYVRWRG